MGLGEALRRGLSGLLDLHLREIPLMSSNPGVQPAAVNSIAPTPPFPGQRVRRTIGHPAMAGAIGASLRRIEAAIGEILLRWIAERPSAAVDLLDVREPHPPHLPDLGVGKKIHDAFLSRSRGKAGVRARSPEMGSERGIAARRGRVRPPERGSERGIAR